MSHIDLVFENLRLYHVLSQNDLYSNLKFNKANILDIDFDNIRETNEKGDDGVHAGPKAHQIFAELIAKEIKNDTR
jgi:lysophospholipase L1-like esterase